MSKTDVEQELFRIIRIILAEVRSLQHGQDQILEAIGVQKMTLDELTTQVQANTDAEDGAATLLGQLADLIKANANDPAKVQQLGDQLKQHADALAAAIVANTPAGP